MTLRKQDGRWSPAKITLACTVVATAATCIIAMPVAFDYCGKAVAPWTTLPAKLDAMKHDLEDIKNRLPEPPSDYAAATNRVRLTRRE